MMVYNIDTLLLSPHFIQISLVLPNVLFLFQNPIQDTFYLVVMTLQASLDCDHVSGFLCFWWPWQLEEYFAECPSTWVCLVFSLLLGFGDFLEGGRPQRPSARSSHHFTCYLPDIASNVKLGYLDEVVLLIFLHCKVTLSSFHPVLFARKSPWATYTSGVLHYFERGVST